MMNDLNENSINRKTRRWRCILIDQLADLRAVVNGTFRKPTVGKSRSPLLPVTKVNHFLELKFHHRYCTLADWYTLATPGWIFFVNHISDEICKWYTVTTLQIYFLLIVRLVRSFTHALTDWMPNTFGVLRDFRKSLALKIIFPRWIPYMGLDFGLGSAWDFDERTDGRTDIVSVSMFQNHLALKIEMSGKSFGRRDSFLDRQVVLVFG